MREAALCLRADGADPGLYLRINSERSEGHLSLALISVPSKLVGSPPCACAVTATSLHAPGARLGPARAQVLGSMLVYPNRMNFKIMPNGGQPPVPVGMLRIRVVDTDMSSGGLHIPLPHLHKVGGPWPADMIGLIGSHGHVLGRPAQRAAAPAQGRHHLPCRQGRFLGFGSRHAHLPAQRCYCSVSFVMTQFILDQSCVHISRRSAAGAQQATGVLSALHIPLTSAGNRRTRPLG